jgi:alcohol dehydrogenase (cytochrome c)
VQTADNELMESHTGAPLVIGDLAINGVTGAEYGIRGHLDAVDLNTGTIKWTTYTIPAPGEPGNETWEDQYDAWMTGGGSIWQTGTYDPELNLTYWGVGNPSPQFDSEYRPGDNLYTESTIALDVDTGEIKWHFQYTPNDPYDYDEVGEAQLIDIAIAGEDRNLAVKVARNGHVYGFDRANGQFLYAIQYVEVVNWTDGIDQKTGRPMSYDPNLRGLAQGYAPGTPGRRDGRLAVFCPHLGGGKNWQPAAYNRNTQLLYTGSFEACSAYTTTVGGVGHWADKGNKLGTLKNREPKGWRGRESVDASTPKPLMDARGSVTAIDPTTGQTVAKVMTRARPSGILTTAGGLVFSADETGDIYALDADTLETLWVRNLGTGMAAPPMSYSYGGKQYIAILVGRQPGGTTRRQYPETANMQATNMLFVFAL